MPDSKGLVLSNKANRTDGKHIHNYSTFDKSLSYRNALTLRFGDYTPTFEMEGVPDDSISVNSSDRIDSLSLNAPFKGSIRKIKESFKVPNMAILPMQWDKIYAQPSNGDDVPLDANCVLLKFWQRYTDFWQNLLSLLTGTNAITASSSAADVAAWLTALVRTMVLGEYVFSAGSLLHVSGYKYGVQVFRGNIGSGTYDAWFDAIITAAFKSFKMFQVKVPVGSTQYPVNCLGLASAPDLEPFTNSFRNFLELFRENPLCSIDSSGFVHQTSLSATATQIVTDLLTASTGLLRLQILWRLPQDNSGELSDDVTELNPTSLNLSRILAYQLVCAHFYTNSSIDFVYSAELYRQYVNYWSKLSFDSLNAYQGQVAFSWNGTLQNYDYLSGHMLERGLYMKTDGSAYRTINWATLSGNFITNPVGDMGRFALFSVIFGFRKSLRYGDYFTGSRPRPLAPINTDVAVANNAVSVVDITRNIQAQRFANAVMRSRSKIEEYVKSLFGRAPAPDYHNPFFLSREEEIIFGDEVQNTGQSQTSDANSRTANFASNLGRYTFTFDNDDAHPCIYLQIVSFDIRRCYTRSVERQFLHLDRFDMFNPDFQYIGDQPIYGVELGYLAGTNPPAVFSYTSRDMEYKQRFDQASGGFLENLPGWILTDFDRSRRGANNLDPDFIRSYNTELDQFFLSLTGYSLASYFHFICITDNNVSARRAMAVDPQILA